MGEKKVLIFEKLVKLVRRRNFSYTESRKIFIMIPEIENSELWLESEDGLICPSMIRLLRNHEQSIMYNDTEYIITNHLKKFGQDLDGLSNEELKHRLHYSEYCINNDKYKTEYIKVYMER